MSRAWGYWTRGKLDVLRDYLDAFTTACTKSRETIYIDAFAGVHENLDRLSGETIDGSPRVALGIDSPPFTCLRFFELPAKAQALEEVLRQDFPGRDFEVRAGDSNEEVVEELKRLQYLSWAPTFAFVDPNGMEAKWSMLEALASFRSGRPTKVELFVLFAAPMFTRLLRVDGSDVRPEDEAAIDSMFGCTEWRRIYEARLAGEVDSTQARDDYIDLMRWRIENVLGYEWTHLLAVHNEGGVPIYHMIFATDHKAGTKIMSNLYAKAAAEFPAMREEARRLRRQLEDEEHGVMSLFNDDQNASFEAPIKRGERFYDHVPPNEPWCLRPPPDGPVNQ